MKAKIVNYETYYDKVDLLHRRVQVGRSRADNTSKFQGLSVISVRDLLEPRAMEVIFVAATGDLQDSNSYEGFRISCVFMQG